MITYENVQSMKQSVALITGANTGIGRVTALTLARRGYQLILAGRSEQRTQAVIDEILQLGVGKRPHYIPLALDDLDSVRACVKQVIALDLPIRLLINNAGVAGLKGKTKQSYEMAFGVNHLGHFLLTQGLLNRLQSNSPSRIIHVASRAHWMARSIPWENLRSPTRSLTGVSEYAVSKLCNILYTKSLAQRLKHTGISCYALHPGVVATEIWRSVPGLLRPLLRLRPMLSPEEGAATTLHCIDHASTEQSGMYFADCRVAAVSPLAAQSGLADRLWHFSEQACSR
jgi:NAD(P)-dependent dehydrogenase (short-subunit alcohol dehydrogenase family)